VRNEQFWAVPIPAGNPQNVGLPLVNEMTQHDVLHFDGQPPGMLLAFDALQPVAFGRVKFRGGNTWRVVFSDDKEEWIAATEAFKPPQAEWSYCGVHRYWALQNVTNSSSPWYSQFAWFEYFCVF
jgi:hypothetical protein